MLKRCRWATTSRREHLLQNRQNPPKSAGRHSTEFPNQPVAINGPYLIANDMANLSLKSTRHSKRIRMTARGERSYNMCPKMRVQFIW
jgi:hypothetical protein